MLMLVNSPLADPWTGLVGAFSVQVGHQVIATSTLSGLFWSWIDVPTPWKSNESARRIGMGLAEFWHFRKKHLFFLPELDQTDRVTGDQIL
jgi:hypothetical protein